MSISIYALFLNRVDYKGLYAKKYSYLFTNLAEHTRINYIMIFKKLCQEIVEFNPCVIVHAMNLPQGVSGH